MDRYAKYFLQHILYLDDGFNKYYVQDKAWGRQEVLDVESVIFDWADDAERWLNQCTDHDRYETISHLRSFLGNDCAERYLVHRMSDRQVMHTVARQMTQGLYQIVIKPRLGWAVQVDADTATPALPLRVEPEPDLDDLLTGLKTDLDDLVAEQQKQYDQYEAQLRGMNAAQRALFIKQQMDGAAYDTAIGDNLDLIKAAPGAIWSAAKAFPGFYKGYLKFLWKIAQMPGKMAGLTAQAVATGDINPLKDEIDKIVTPVAATYEEAMEYKSMLTILCSEPEVYELFYDFSERYYEATHPIELAKMGTSAVTEVLITVLLAIFTAGTGAAANMAAKSGKLVKVFKLLKKITKTIKKISPNLKLLDRSKNAAKKTKKTRKATAKRAKGMPDVDSPKKTKKLEKTDKKKYGDDKDSDLKKPAKKEFTDFTEADEWGKKNYKGWVDNLSVSEREAVTEYTGASYKNINDVLRGKESAYTGRNAEFSENISSALKKAEVPEDLIVYRGASKSALGELKKLPKEDMVGKVIEDKGFMSTSMLKNSSFNGDVKMKINVPKGTNGAYVGDISYYPEAEMLLDKGQKMIITEASEDSIGRLILACDVLP